MLQSSPNWLITWGNTVLATFIIGLREGLEATLIVSIIAAFLRRNGKSLVPMAIGVAAAVLVSLAVGVSLNLVEKSLPQAAQEGMETVIGIVAVVFVTTMVLWMGRHAHELGAQLENDAQQALSSGSILVGRDGEVLEALQELCRLAVMTKTGHHSRLMLDVAGHREKRRKELQLLAQDAVNSVNATGEPVRLAPMNPFERKVVHDAVAAAGMHSESEGQEPQRRVVVQAAR